MFLSLSLFFFIHIFHLVALHFCLAFDFCVSFCWCSFHFYYSYKRNFVRNNVCNPVVIGAMPPKHSNNKLLLSHCLYMDNTIYVMRKAKWTNCSVFTCILYAPSTQQYVANRYVRIAIFLFHTLTTCTTVYTCTHTIFT